jgi:hypothetical protein
LVVTDVPPAPPPIEVTVISVPIMYELLPWAAADPPFPATEPPAPMVIVYVVPILTAKFGPLGVTLLVGVSEP